MIADNALEFPFPEAPGKGSLVTVMPGVAWVRMALPLVLDHINVYVLDDGNGCFIVDTGMNLAPTREAWEQLFSGALTGRPVTGVLATHMHPDHCGLAGWLCEHFRVPLYMTLGEYFTARVYSGPPPEALPWTTEQFFRRHGMNDEFIAGSKRRMRGFGAMVGQLPGAYHRLRDGDVLSIGGNDWRVIIGRGHSPEHACLYCESLGVLISGDQVIPGITSNVSVMATEPEANPLADWLASHERFLGLPADTLVLPAHKLPFRGLHARLRQLIAHHEDHMLALEEACVEPKTVPQLLPVLFGKSLGESVMSMAIGECISHLHLLMARGRIERTLPADGVYRYRSIDPTLPQRATGHHPVGDANLMV